MPLGVDYRRVLRVTHVRGIPKTSAHLALWMRRSACKRGAVRMCLPSKLNSACFRQAPA